MSNRRQRATGELPDTIARIASEVDGMLAASDRALDANYPGERSGRQPVHTAYVPADRFHPDLAADWGRQALAALAEYAPSPADFEAAMGLPDDLGATVRERVTAKLSNEPVEDLRLDFEDGYKPVGHADNAEDTDALAAAGSLAAAAAFGIAPPFTGLRCKSLEAATRPRAIRTISLFLAELLAHGPLPAGFMLTFPKVSSADQVRAMAVLCDRLEHAFTLPPGSLVFEIQAETPQLVLGADGNATIARCVHAGGERLVGVHYGTYDYAASLGVAGEFQRLDHPAADHARAVLQVAVAAQLASRYAATYGFFLAGVPRACDRLRSYTGSADSGTFEEPATARALAGFLLRGLDCRALSAADVSDRCGLDRAALAALRQARR